MAGWKARARRMARALREQWGRDSLIDVAGSLTFFGLLAVFPFLIFLVSLTSLLLDPRAVESILESLEQVAPDEVVQIIGGELDSLIKGDRSGLLTASFVGAFWSASGGITSLIRALNRANGVKESRPFWKVRGIAFLSTIAVAVISLIACVIVLLIPALPSTWISRSLLWLRLPIAGMLMTLIWALIYGVLPDTGKERKLRLITPGSIVGVLVWIAASWGFSAYVSSLGKYDVTYGALGGVVVFLLWMWISAFALLLGAEINVAWDRVGRAGRPPGG